MQNLMVDEVIRSGRAPCTHGIDDMWHSAFSGPDTDGRLDHCTSGLTLIYGVRCDSGSLQSRISIRFRTPCLQYSAPERVANKPIAANKAVHATRAIDPLAFFHLVLFCVAPSISFNCPQTPYSMSEYPSRRRPPTSLYSDK